MARTDIRGVESTLKALKDIDPKLYRAAQKRLKSDAKPMLAAAKAALPPVALSNWKPPVQDTGGVSRSGAARMPAYVGGVARRKTVLQIKREKVRGMSGRRTLFRMVQRDAAGSVFDMAGKASQNLLARNLSAKFGKPSRSMWPAAEKHMPGVLRSIENSVGDMAKEVNRELSRRR